MHAGMINCESIWLGLNSIVLGCLSDNNKQVDCLTVATNYACKLGLMNILNVNELNDF